MSALFPNVPVATGVPIVLRNLANANDAVAALPSDDTPLIGSNDWGVFDRSGTKLVDPDNVVSFEYHAEHRISDYPIENGGFQSYNKVALPCEVHLVMSRGGSVADRSDFLTALEQLRASLDLCDVVTPERVYVGMNVTRLAQNRSAEAGAGLAAVEVVFEEVRQTATVAYSTAPAVTTNESTTGSGAQTTTTAAPKIGTEQPTAASKAIGKVSNDFWRKGATQNPASALTVNQGAVQPRAGLALGETVTKSADGKYTIFSFKGIK